MSDEKRLWYVGDPCYVITQDWDLFCQKTWDEKGVVSNEDSLHMDSIIEWKGHTLEIWSNGGDGCWRFNFEGKTIPLNGSKAHFGVDAGIFCVMPVEISHIQNLDELKRLGIIFRGEKPELYVEDHIVYINDVADECECEEE